MPLDHSPRAAIIGAGLMGQWHARYASRRGVRIVSVVDENIARAETLARRYPGAAAYSSLAESLEKSPLDAAHVCVPTAHHFEICRQSLGAGLHVLVEKPAAESAEQTQHLLQLAAARQRRFAVSLQLPYQAGFREFLEQRPSLGDPVRVEFSVATAGGDALDSAGRRDVLWEILPHPLSVFSSLFGSQTFEADWLVERFDDNDLELSASCGGARWLIRLSLRERPRSLKLDWRATNGRAEIDFFHGYSVIHRGESSRADKLVRPFREASEQLSQAGSNLLRRAVRRETAYPGLFALISGFYDSIAGKLEGPSEAEMLGIARLADSVRQGRLLRRR